MSVDKRIAALALNLLTVFLAFVGLILVVVFTPWGSFSFETNVLGFILALAVITSGLAFYFQVSKA